MPQDLSGENISNCNNCGRACFLVKLHTIRANYPLWEKRIKDIQEGHAVLSVRQWSGKPYRSKASGNCTADSREPVSVFRNFPLIGQRTEYSSLKYF